MPKTSLGAGLLALEHNESKSLRKGKTETESPQSHQVCTEILSACVPSITLDERGQFNAKRRESVKRNVQ